MHGQSMSQFKASFNFCLECIVGKTSNQCGMLSHTNINYCIVAILWLNVPSSPSISSFFPPSSLPLPFSSFSLSLSPLPLPLPLSSPSPTLLASSQINLAHDSLLLEVYDENRVVREYCVPRLCLASYCL